MQETLHTIQTADGAMDTVVVDPWPAERCPLAIVYMDVWGIREELIDVARRVATMGYRCALPDLYYRQGRVRHEHRDAAGRMITLERLSDEEKETVRASLRQLSDEMVAADTGALLDALTNASDGAVGAIGYCMGGRHAFRAAAAYPNKIAAIASLHGTSLATDHSHSPHLAAAHGRADIYCGFAERDPHGAPAVRDALAKAFADKPFVYEFSVHLGAEHGYALPDRDVFDKHAANVDWAAIVRMFQRRLSPRTRTEQGRVEAAG